MGGNYLGLSRAPRGGRRDQHAIRVGVRLQVERRLKLSNAWPAAGFLWLCTFYPFCQCRSLFSFVDNWCWLFGRTWKTPKSISVVSESTFCFVLEEMQRQISSALRMETFEQAGKRAGKMDQMLASCVAGLIVSHQLGNWYAQFGVGLNAASVRFLLEIGGGCIQPRKTSTCRPQFGSMPIWLGQN